MAEEQAQADSTGEQRGYEWVDRPSIWRSVLTRPEEAIVRYNFHSDRTKILAPSGYWLLQKYGSHPMAREVYDEMPVPEFREVFSHRVFPVLTLREDVLFKEEDVTISVDDVRRSVAKAKKRVGPEFAAILMAEPEEE